MISSFLHSGFPSNLDLGLVGEAVAIGLFLGSDEDLPWELKRQARQLGITHFMAASGANLQRVWSLGTVFGFGWYWWQELFGVGALLIYLWCAGLSPSLVRATSVWAYRLLGRWNGTKTYFAFESIVAVVFSECIQKNVLFSAGWQLSFLATLGMFFSQTFLSGEKDNSILTQNKKARIFSFFDVKTSLWVFACVVPYTWWRFQSARPMSVLVTPTLEPLVRPFQALFLAEQLISVLPAEWNWLMTQFQGTYVVLAWTWLKIITLWLTVLNHSKWLLGVESAVVFIMVVTIGMGFLRFWQFRERRRVWRRLAWI